MIAETRPVLAKNGIVALTPICGSDKGLACQVTLIHSSGEERVFEPLPFIASNDPQQAGSAITYFRRYALLAALGMATADDDGAAAKSAAVARKSTRSTPDAPAPSGGGGNPKPCTVCQKPLGTDPVEAYGNGYAHKRCAAS